MPDSTPVCRQSFNTQFPHGNDSLRYAPFRRAQGLAQGSHAPSTCIPVEFRAPPAGPSGAPRQARPFWNGFDRRASKSDKPNLMSHSITRNLALAGSLLAFAAATPGALALTEQEKSYLQAYGWYVGMQAGLSELALNSEELEQFVVGMKAAGSGQKPPADPRELGQKMQEYLQGKAEAQRVVAEKKAAEQAVANKKAATDFLAKLDADKDVKKTASGLRYKIEKEGAAPKPGPTDDVTVHYTGKLTNGEEFDSSRKRNEPATFNLDRVIPGFKEGLQLVGKGGKITLFVPPELGYGDRDLPGIPPGSLLVFDVEMLDSKKPEAKPAAPVLNIKPSADKPADKAADKPAAKPADSKAAAPKSDAKTDKAAGSK